MLDRIPKREYPSPVRMNISRIDSEGRNRNYIYQLLDRRPQRGYLSPVKVNISRINSASGEKQDLQLPVTGQKTVREGKPSSVRMNISRIDSLGNEIGIVTTFLLGRIPKMRISVTD